MRLFKPDECTGKGGYPPEWHATIKHAVREAAGNRCVRCLHPYEKGAGEWSPCDRDCVHAGEVRYARNRELNGWYGPVKLEADILAGGVLRIGGWEEVEARWRILTVHHLDGNKGNCRWWNLVALCQRCHLTIQGRVKMERTWPWEHSDWFKPYVAGYYAWTYLGEEITREEAEERMDDLLALERVA